MASQQADRDVVVVNAQHVTSSSTWLGLSDGALFRLAVAIAAAPILISAIHNGLSGWYPTGDAALTAVRINDVFSAHPPLIGLPAMPGAKSGIGYNFPGALQLYLMAVPVKLLGVRWGLLLGVGALNTAWFVTAMWLIRRRVGYRFGIVACAFGASLLWTLGSQILIDVTPLQVGIIAFLAFLVAAWSVAEADTVAFLPLAVTANFLVLSQLKFTLVVPVVGITAVVLWVCRTRTARATQPTAEVSQDRRRRRWWIGASILFTVIVWIPPIIQQLFFPGGNLGKLLSATTGGSAPSHVGAHRTILDTIGVVTGPVTTWPLWLRNSFDRPVYGVDGPTTRFVTGLIGIVIVIVIVVWVVRNARHRRDRNILTMLGLWTVAIVCWAISAQLNPSPHAYFPPYFHELWPLSMLLWFTLAIGVVRSGWGGHLLRRPGASTWAIGATLATTVALVALSVPIVDFGAGTRQSSLPLAQRVRRAVLDKVPDGGPIYVRNSNFGAARTVFPVVLLALQKRGIAFRVRPGWDGQIYGASREFKRHPPNATRSIIITQAPLSRPNDHLIVHAAKFRLDPAEQRAVGAKLKTWARSLESLHVPADVEVSNSKRRGANQFFARSIRQAKTTDRTVFDLPDFVKVVALLNATNLKSMFPVPGLSGGQIRDWLRDAQTAATTGVWVYLAPMQ